MALGKNNQDNGKLLVLRIQNKTTDLKTGVETPLSPHQFEISEKIDGKWTVRPELESRVSGNLSKIQIEEKEYEGNPYKAFKFYLNDSETNETYLLDLRSTMVSRNLFNSLLALETFDGLQISLYNKTSKKDGKDYTNVSLWQGENMVKGKFSLDELPKPEEIKNKQGKTAYELALSRGNLQLAKLFKQNAEIDYENSYEYNIIFHIYPLFLYLVKFPPYFIIGYSVTYCPGNV
jgi:hypothetical protein